MRIRVKPTRDDVEVYANLDKLIAEPLKFELFGKVRRLKPVTTEEFYKLVNALVTFNDLTAQTDTTPDQVIDKISDVFCSICDDITREDVSKMNRIQIGALYSLIMEHAYGKSHKLTPEDLKKKTMAMFQP